ncbi:MAG: response regulator [Gammaproteobacteria bacterium]|nr:response regulator [Gammaproteobacteria bacterium]
MDSRKILVIEDNAKNMKLVHLLLTMGEHQVLESTDAEQGIQIARQEKPDLILMDIQLPGMDGLQATGIIKADPQLADIPIVALTSYAMESDQARALDTGCEGYLSKPIDTKTFLGVVETFLQPDSGDAVAVLQKRKHNDVRILVVDDNHKVVSLRNTTTFCRRLTTASQHWR